MPEPSQEIEAYIRESFIKALEQPGVDKARVIGETVDLLLKQVGDSEKEAPTRACIFHRAVLSFTPHGELAQYVNDGEYIGYCLRLATTIGTYNVYESEHIFRTLKDQRVGRHDARFYCQWAQFALAQSLPDKAHKVITKGIQVGAQPKNLLDEMLIQIQSDRESPSEPAIAQTPGPGGANPLSRVPSTPAAGMGRAPGRDAQGRGGFLATPAAKGNAATGESPTGIADPAAAALFETLRWAEDVPKAKNVFIADLQAEKASPGLIAGVADRVYRATSGNTIEIPRAPKAEGPQ